MDLARFAKNVLFALLLFLVSWSIAWADWPITQRLEEYIAFVLTTDVDIRPWFEASRAPGAAGDGWLAGSWLGRWAERFAGVPAGGPAEPGR